MRGLLFSKEEFVRINLEPMAKALSNQILQVYYQRKLGHDYVTLILRRNKHMDIEVDRLDCVDLTVKTLKQIKEDLI
jgi:hypothetical protein